MSRDGASKNPYADRGLDKFYALLADLDDKKQKIYTQKGSEDISSVRFVYDNDSDCVKPIVIKVKDRSPPKSAKNFKSNDAAPAETEAKSEKTMKKKRSLRCKGNFKLEDLKRPQLFFPVMVVLILLFLAIYGRSFAILCTSIVWYLAPTISGTATAAGGERKPKRKKEYERKRSEKMAVHSEGPSSPKTVINGLQHDRKCSW
ncbi:hypothetical protein SASPL_103031 [Salvia splendens]|uniref:ZCF37 n=1 Tax=Salvia splendens TaxID=180675 RepID=A0A8X8YXS4_SALSN|nr:uncharacterized protein LOC121792374 [Salvia splendens]KAG6438095.1 hypothetical protein SASPL_103031 [Salvia splendens]